MAKEEAEKLEEAEVEEMRRSSGSSREREGEGERVKRRVGEMESGRETTYLAHTSFELTAFCTPPMSTYARVSFSLA